MHTCTCLRLAAEAATAEALAGEQARENSQSSARDACQLQPLMLVCQLAARLIAKPVHTVLVAQLETCCRLAGSMSSRPRSPLASWSIEGAQDCQGRPIRGSSAAVKAVIKQCAMRTKLSSCAVLGSLTMAAKLCLPSTRKADGSLTLTLTELRWEPEQPQEIAGQPVVLSLQAIKGECCRLHRNRVCVCLWTRSLGR